MKHKSEIINILAKIEVDFTELLSSNDNNIKNFILKMRELKLIKNLKQEKQLIKELSVIKKTNNEGYFNILSSSFKISRDKGLI